MENALKTLFPSVGAKLIGFLYLVALVWWVVIFLTGAKDTLQNYLFGVLLAVVPLVGGVFAVTRSRVWGLFASSMGRAVFFLGLGLITWAVGTLIFAYYNLAQSVEVPYPSLADAAYIISWPLWAIGIINLSRATGARYGIRQSSGKELLLVIPLVVILASYYLLVVVARGGFDFSESTAFKAFFDLAYPIGDVIILALATLVYGLSVNYFGGKFKTAIYFILAGFVLNYISDFAFSYTTTLETFYVASWVDLLFLTTMSVLSLGATSLDVVAETGDATNVVT